MNKNKTPLTFITIESCQKYFEVLMCLYKFDLLHKYSSNQRIRL